MRRHLRIRGLGHEHSARSPQVPIASAAPVRTVDRTDSRLLQALEKDPRATVVGLAERLGLSRNTVQPRLTRLESDGVLHGFGRRVDPAALGYPISAMVMAVVKHREAHCF